MVFIEEKKLMFQVFSIKFFVKFQEDFVVLPLLHMILRGNPGVCHAMAGTGMVPCTCVFQTKYCQT